MTQDGTTILEWTYEPIDLFEEPLDVEILSSSVHIEGGKARGDFPWGGYEKAKKIRDQVHAELEPHFVSQQIITGKTLKLNPAILIRESPSGTREVYMSAELRCSAKVTAQIDATIRGKDGNIISDTRADRLNEQKVFREKVARCAVNFPEIKAMQASFQKSFDDEENCFIHLYEIRDRLGTIFGNEKDAKAALGKEDWKTVGKLSNADPTNAASRHRGKATNHKTPSQSTLGEGRKAAQRLIRAYVDHLCRS